jgi:2-iminobutanoate/2-iminopropanoate deaminase
MGKIGHYTSLTEANGFVFCSGQVGLDTETGYIVKGIGAQTKLALLTINDLLSPLGLGLTSVVKVTVYLTRDEDFDDMNTVYKDTFGASLPARTTVIVKSLPKAPTEGPEPILVEIDVIAAK